MGGCQGWVGGVEGGFYTRPCSLEFVYEVCCGHYARLRRVISERDMAAATERPCVPHALSQALPQWPVMLLLDVGPEKDTPVRGKRILVLCSDLGNTVVEVPQHVLRSCVCLLIENFLPKNLKRYGFGVVPFRRGQEATWHCASEEIAIWQALSFIKSLIVHHGALEHVTMLGASAGGLKAMELCRYADAAGLQAAVKLCVLIATAYHPVVLPDFCELMYQGTLRCIVLHHDRDELCHWHECEGCECCRQSCLHVSRGLAISMSCKSKSDLLPHF